MKLPADLASPPNAVPAETVWGHDEFAPGADEWADLELDGVSRRSFMARMAAAFALAGVAGTVGCSQRPKGEKLVPYVNPSDEVIPGKPLTFTTAMTMGGYARGVLATSREGRPIKVDGNPDHPSSLGGSDVFLQASILDLYEPGRAQTPALAGNAVDWESFFTRLEPFLTGAKLTGGRTMRFLSGPITSPVMAEQIALLRKKYPTARWHFDTAIGRSNSTAGAVAAFGNAYNAVYDFSKAQTIVSLDSDFLFDLPGSLRYAREFFARRRVRSDKLEMNRLYAIESTLSMTGSVADHRLPVRPGDVGAIATALAAELGVKGVTADSGAYANFVKPVAEDLDGVRGACLVIAGESQPAHVHALAHAMNVALGNVGKTVTFIEPVEVDPDVVPPSDNPKAIKYRTQIVNGAERTDQSLAALTADMQAGKVGALIILGENPVFTAPKNVPFAEELSIFSQARTPDGSLLNLSAHLTLVANETSYECQWTLPMSHYLEAWGDARGHDGTAAIVQPLINPLYSTRSSLELIAAIAGSNTSSYELVRTHWSKKATGDFETWWATTLKRGTVEGSASPAVALPALKPLNLPPVQWATTEFDLVIRPDYTIWDGSFARNSWLQETPKPFTKLVWDNALLLHPLTADSLGVRANDVVRISVGNRSIEAPVDLVPGLPRGAATIHVGYGHGMLPAVENGVEEPQLGGVNVYPLLTTETTGFIAGVKIEKLDRTYKLVHTRSHNVMSQTTKTPSIDDTTLAHNSIVTTSIPEEERETNNRKLVRVVTLDELRDDKMVVKKLGSSAEAKGLPVLTLYDGWDYSKGYQWGMTIDQTACMGCNACAVACQAENNIAVVGKEQVANQREMAWLRIDDYFGGDMDHAQVYHQPVPCMHCENAPCEYVCPVGATSHSSEGLNQMTYNRCVGTRYCSNNCSYKVRRFNFLDYTGPFDPEQRHLLSNPEVTVRVRGVMEKCSYCVQRIQNTRVQVEVMTVQMQEQAGKASDETEKKAILDELASREYQTIESLQSACQQACPTQAISFGSIIPVAGKMTTMQALKAQPTDYVLLRELTTKPRTSYLANVKNLNPALATTIMQTEKPA